jgi:hypothetical protein
MTPPSLPIQKSAATLFGYRFLNQHQQSFWLLIFESAATQLLAANL